MKLLGIRAKNFRCFAELELDLNVDGLVAVIGPNGAGKSTLFGAIEWALYGGSRGRGVLPARRDGCPESEPCFVEVEFEVGGRGYLVRRIDRKEAQLLDLASGDLICTGLDETSRQAASRLGLTREMFRGTFYARQREVQALDSSDELRRRAQVELLLGIERLRRATAHAHAAVKEQSHLVAALETGVPDVEALRAEVERLRSEAEDGALTLKAAEERVERARAGRDRARGRLDTLRAQEREMLGRRARAQSATTKSEQARVAREGLRDQVAEATGAEAELTGLTPVAAEVDTLVVKEREMDLARTAHERAAGLREQQRLALSTAARLTDQLAELTKPVEVGAADGEGVAGVGGSRGKTNGGWADPEAVRRQIQAAEERIDELRSQQREWGPQRAQAERQLEILRDRVRRSERAVVLDGELAERPAAERTLETALARWHDLNARRTHLVAAIEHDRKHRESVLAGTEQAECPTCKRSYDPGQLDEIIASYDRDLRAALEELTHLDRQLDELKNQGTVARADAERLRALAAERQALADGLAVTADALDALRREIAGLEDEIRTKEGVEVHAEAELVELTAGLPALRGRERAAEEHRRHVADLNSQRLQVEREAHGYADQLVQLGSNGYDVQAHTRLRTRLREAQAAAQRCALLRGKADGLELLRRRLADQEAIVGAAEAEEAQVHAAVAEVAIGTDMLREAEGGCTAADSEFEMAHSALIEVSRHASVASQAVAAAQTRLQDVRERVSKLRDERRELRVRSEVADALSAFREDASRRARPTLEHETGLLLGQVTRGRYGAVELSDSYQLEIAEGQQLHPLRRYSGGEQDLAGLCLRLGLSRLLARQRGAETGFVLLDEVFGSQDADRRRALLEQLHAIAEAEFRQVFVVSHTDDVVEHCDLTIEVERDDDGVSTASGPRR